MLSRRAGPRAAPGTDSFGNPDAAADPPGTETPTDGGGDSEPPDTGTRGSESPPESADPPESENAPTEAEVARVTRIMELGKTYSEEEMAARALLDPNLTADQFAERILAKSRQNGAERAAEANLPERYHIEPKDLESFRISHLMLYLYGGKRGTEGGAEYEICNGYAKLQQKQGIGASGTPIPPQIFDASVMANRRIVDAHRILTAGTDASGGYLVADELRPDVIDVLLENNVTTRLVRKLPDLQGNIPYPRQLTRAQAQVVGETAGQRLNRASRLICRPYNPILCVLTRVSPSNFCDRPLFRWRC